MNYYLRKAEEAQSHYLDIVCPTHNSEDSDPHSPLHCKYCSHGLWWDKIKKVLRCKNPDCRIQRKIVKDITQKINDKFIELCQMEKEVKP